MSDNLTVWAGNVKIVKLGADGTPPSTEGEDRLQTCAGRSLEKETRLQKSCCGSYSQEAYVCNTRGIFNVQASVCHTCDRYTKR